LLKNPGFLRRSHWLLSASLLAVAIIACTAAVPANWFRSAEVTGTIIPLYTLTIYSSPTEVTFTVDDVSHTAPWSDTYGKGASVSLVMPETHTVGDVRYYWDQWSDGVTTRSRTVTMNTNITLTTHYAGPYHIADINGDGIVDILDVVIVALAFGSYPRHPRWNPIADIKQDGLIDIYDLVTVGVNFGKRLPP